MDEDEGPIPTPPAPPAPPPKEDIRIRDLTARPHACTVCGKAKEAYIEVIVDGVVEYTCRDCYEGDVVELVACRTCGAAVEPGDNFCGKCGTPRLQTCPTCGGAVDEEDRFCGKCGSKIT